MVLEQMVLVIPKSWYFLVQKHRMVKYYANFGEDVWGPAFDPNLLVYQWDAFDPSSKIMEKQHLG